MQLESIDYYKALGDETRYGLFSVLLESPQPLSTSELAARVGLHPNTVRPHLERMRQVGLLELEISSAGTVGRPCHRYRPVGHNRPAGAFSTMKVQSLQEESHS
jgi:predicted ArsR family transcriptional regulator